MVIKERTVINKTNITRDAYATGRWELLVQWDGLSVADATWEPLADFKERYLVFQPSDKLFVAEEGNVVDSFVGKQYRHRLRGSHQVAKLRLVMLGTSCCKLSALNYLC